MDYSMATIRNAHRGHWFDRDTLRFFRSRISEEVYQGPGGVFFVSSEQFTSGNYSEPRRYTVRRFVETDGSIDSATEFNVLGRAQAHRQAKALAAGTQECLCSDCRYATGGHVRATPTA